MKIEIATKITAVMLLPIAAGLNFGLWQQSFSAGFFMFCFTLAIQPQVK